MADVPVMEDHYAPGRLERILDLAAKAWPNRSNFELIGDERDIDACVYSECGTDMECLCIEINCHFKALDVLEAALVMLADRSK